jgi:hypothetical protein
MSADATQPAASDAPPPYTKIQGPYSDEELYLAVTRAWCRLPSRQIRRERTLREYIFGWRFVTSVERTPVDVKSIIRAVLQIVSRSPVPNDGAVSLALPPDKRGVLDASAAWWHPIHGADDLGVHYVELQNGTLALLAVASRADQPDPGDSQ